MKDSEKYLETLKTMAELESASGKTGAFTEAYTAAKRMKKLLTDEQRRSYDTFIVFVEEGDFIVRTYEQNDEEDEASFKDRFFTDASAIICDSDISGAYLCKAFYKGRKAHYMGWQPDMVFSFSYDDCFNEKPLWTGQFLNWDH